MKKTILCFMGRSASGKDTLANKFLQYNDTFDKIIPVTNRPMRDGEVDGVDCNFKTTKDMIELISDNKLMEHRKYKVHTNYKDDIWYYGTPFPEANYSIMINTLDMFLELKNKYKDSIDIYPIYITVSDEELLYRSICREMKNKNPNYRETCRRFLADKEDYSPKKIAQAMQICNFDCIVENYNIHKSIDKINKYVKDTILI